jgi:hypothetical protein
VTSVKARQLYTVSEYFFCTTLWLDFDILVDKMRLLYDREQVTARIVVKSKADLQVPLVSLTCSVLGTTPKFSRARI